MTPETLNKVIKLVKIHMKSAGDSADYWEKVDSNDARRFRSIALAEYMAYSHMLNWLQDEKTVDLSLEIWDS